MRPDAPPGAGFPRIPGFPMRVKPGKPARQKASKYGLCVFRKEKPMSLNLNAFEGKPKPGVFRFGQGPFYSGRPAVRASTPDLLMRRAGIVSRQTKSASV